MDRQHTILVHYSEIGLKGRNRPQFLRQLRENLRCKLRARQLDWPVRESPGHLSIPAPPEADEAAVAAALDSVREVFGVAWCARAWHLAHGGFTAATQAADLAALREAVLAQARERCAPDQAFCVRVRRSLKTLPLTSPELEFQLGEAITRETPWRRVNLKQPDVTFHVEIHPAGAFVFSEKRKGAGGLPVGTSGRVLALLSGGIDSPVAVWCVARRGCRVDFLHFTAAGASEAEIRASKVWRLARRLGEFTLRSRLFVVPYTRFDLALMQAGFPVAYEVVLFRRFMARMAARLAGQLGAAALVSGDSLSQVASQTLSNLVSTSRATDMPILRPLLGYDKEEIVERAIQIGTYEVSIEPYKDCCALLSRHPKTRSRHADLAELERRIFPEYDRLVEQTLAEVQCLEVRLAAASAPAAEDG